MSRPQPTRPNLIDARSYAGISRRGALTVGVTAAAATSLAACGKAESHAPAAKVDITIPTSKVPVGQGYVDTKNSVVVSQPTAGTYKAFSSVCTHQGCQVSPPQGEVITCACHGSQFDAKTGEVKAGPAEEALAAKDVKLIGDKLHITG